MVTLFLEKEENNINVMVVGLFLNIGNTGKIKFFFEWDWILSDYKSISIDKVKAKKDAIVEKHNFSNLF